MNKEQLKPCPFCGSENVYEKIPDSTGCLPNYVKCYTCGAYTTVGIWNKRKNIRPETADKKGWNKLKALLVKEQGELDDRYYLVTGEAKRKIISGKLSYNQKILKIMQEIEKGSK